MEFKNELLLLPSLSVANVMCTLRALFRLFLAKNFHFYFHLTSFLLSSLYDGEKGDQYRHLVLSTFNLF